jgi:sarcosine oxidase subunit gamma
MTEVSWERAALPSIQTLRLFDTREEAIAEASRRLGFDVPVTACRLTVSWPRSARLAPDEWLVMRSSAQVIGAALSGVLHHVSEVGPGRAGFRLTGAAAGDLLACGCSLDLHLRAFAPGACVRTLIGGIGGILMRPHEENVFDLVVERPHADYLATWLADAAVGFAA